ncbi:MAG: protoheme IX farnesyltransferase [Bacteroidota bacterium]
MLKYKVSLAVSFTAITGYILYTKSFDIQIIKLASAVFILAGGASALNQFQERAFDAKMKRCMHRPLPSGKITPLTALFTSILCIVTGTLLLFYFFDVITALLGLFNIIWYNLLYTNLKKITAFAVVPGSLTGAIPVFMGWTAAGGSIFESAIVFIAFFIFIWQIPHFWLLMLKYGKEYEEAGFPTINQKLNPVNLKRIIFSWMLATSVFSMLLPLFILNISISFFIAIFILNILLVGIFTKLSFGKAEEINFKTSFISINIYMFLFMLMLCIFNLLNA